MVIPNLIGDHFSNFFISLSGENVKVKLIDCFEEMNLNLRFSFALSTHLICFHFEIFSP